MPPTRSHATPPLPGVFRKTLGWLAFGAILLIVATVATDLFFVFTGHDRVHGLVPLVNLRVEGHLASWFQALLLLSCAIAAGAVAWARERAGLPEWRRHWRALAVIFLYLSADEGAAMHEFLNEPLRDAFGFTGMLYFPWVIPYAAFTAVFAAAYLRFLRAFEPWYRVRIAASGVLYVGGALGVELVQAAYYSAHGEDWTYRYLWLLGETLEMAGLLLFLFTLLTYLTSVTGRLSSRL